MWRTDRKQKEEGGKEGEEKGERKKGLLLKNLLFFLILYVQKSTKICSSGIIHSSPQLTGPISESKIRTHIFFFSQSVKKDPKVTHLLKWNKSVYVVHTHVPKTWRWVVGEWRWDKRQKMNCEMLSDFRRESWTSFRICAVWKHLNVKEMIPFLFDISNFQSLPPVSHPPPSLNVLSVSIWEL